MKYRKLVLFFASIVLLVLFFLLPANKYWLNKRIFGYSKEFLSQKDHLSLEYRKAKRFGNHYIYSKQIADSIKEKHREFILIPPTSYFEKNGIKYNPPEPSVFYYFTGLRTVTIKSPYVMKATRLVVVRNEQIVVEKITDIVAIADSINSWKRK